MMLAAKTTGPAYLSLGCLAVLLGMALAVPAQADDWAVSKIQYRNGGAYGAFFYFRFEDRWGNEEDCEPKDPKVMSGQTKLIIIGNPKPKPVAENTCAVVKGNEIWGMIEIDRIAGRYLPANSGCRKDKARYFYHPDGGTVRVFSKGTTENNNRCRIRNNGGVRWDRSKHGRTIYQ